MKCALLAFVSIAILCGTLFCGGQLSGQTPPNGIPFITNVMPPSLPPASTQASGGSFTLTILGANFPANAVVNLKGPGVQILHPTSTTVNASGSQIIAQFTNALSPSPGTYVVTVSNPTSVPPANTSTSNAFYLSETPAAPSVVMNWSEQHQVGDGPTGLVVADVGGIGTPSVAVISQGTDVVSMLASDSGGPFIAGATYPTGYNPRSVVAADIHGTGTLDLVIANASDNTIIILFNGGSGIDFYPGQTISLPGRYPSQMVAGDFNADGHIDLAVVNTCGTGASGCLPSVAPQELGTVTVLLGDGFGGFTVSQAALPVGMIPYSLVQGDFNNDGILDLAVANSGDNTVTVLIGNGDGTFTPTTSSPHAGHGPFSIATGDFNQDGNLDLAVTNSTDGTVSILLNQNCASVAPNACGFAPTPVSIAVGAQPAGIAVGDMNADGFLDLVVANFAGHSLSILLGDGTGSFQPVSPDFSIDTQAQPQSVALGDFNQDGRLDVAFTDSTGWFRVLRQAGVTQVTLTSSNPSPYYGLFVEFTAQVNGLPGQPTPTGSVTFFDGTTPIGTVPLNSYQALIDYPYLSSGAHQVSAAYNGDTNFIPVTSNSVSETVSTAQTTISLGSNITYLSYGQPITFSATVQPQNTGTATGTVEFFDVTSGSTKIGEGVLANNVAQLTVSNLMTGDRRFIATYQGDANLMGSTSASYALYITQAATTTTISASANPINFGQASTLTATVQPGAGNTATGTVTFLDNGNNIGTATLSSNVAQITVSNLSVGSHALGAQFGGDSTFAGSTSNYVLENVNQGSVSVSETVNPNPSTWGQSVTFTTNVAPRQATATPTGSVTFVDGSSNLVSVPLVNGSAQYSVATLNAGAHSILAKYSGDTNYLAGTSPAVPQNVTQAATTITLSADQNPSWFNQQVALTVSVAPASGGTATGSVMFYDGAISLGSATPANNIARLSVSSLSVGTHSLTARYQGDANTSASTSSAVAQTVNAAASSTTVSADLSTTAYGQNVTLTASVNSSFGGVSSGQVSFFDGATPLANATVVSGSAQVAVSNLSVGTHSITAQFLGNGNFTGSTAAGISHSVTAASTATVMVSNANPSSYGQAVTFTATVIPAFNGTPSGTVTFFDGGTTLGTANLSAGVAALSTGATTLAAGTHTVSAKYNGDSNFVPSTSGALTESVAPAATTTVLASNLNPSVSGQTVSFAAHVSSALSGTLTGTVNFYLDGGSSPVSSIAVSGANAQYSTNSLTPGTHSVVAVLVSSNPNFAGSNSAPLSQTVTDFSMSASPASLTISHNGSGAYTLTLTPLNGFTGSVSLTCAGAPSNTSCSISPVQVTLSGTGPTQATVTVSSNKKPSNGNYTLTLTGTSGTVSHTFPVGLTIN